MALVGAGSLRAPSTFLAPGSSCSVRIASKLAGSRLTNLAPLKHNMPTLKPLVHSRRICVVSKISEGDVLPPFKLKDQNGRDVSSDKFRNKPVVLYFYPADETPGCTKQACAFRDSYDKFRKAGAEVVGISGDTPESHRAFAEKYKLPFTLLTDEGNKLRKAWGIPGDLFGTLPGRQTYVLDKEGVVRLVFNNQFQPEKHVNETLKVLQSMLRRLSYFVSGPQDRTESDREAGTTESKGWPPRPRCKEHQKAATMTTLSRKDL